MAKQVRDPQREALWRGVLKRYAASGLSIRAFCQREQLAESAFFAWRRTIRERDAEARRPEQPAFLPVVVEDNQRDGQAFVIELAGGRVLRLPESIPAERLAELVQALEARGGQ